MTAPISAAAPHLSRAVTSPATVKGMKTLDERAIAALGALPEDMRERAVEFLEDQAEKLRVLREMIAEGEADVAAGRVSPLDVKKIFKRARKMRRRGHASQSS
jgi:maleate cis-trans isomerase